ncbi:hypothetical protein GT020_10490 [Glutamicibacter soli]|uniref:Uncharacterized protein n=1 Tax=Glutamicibacter soli TaxID=453836 RepID=A0A6L9G5H9_9MICC|nr:hypothetical protein [Glutamicibacter soli]NAZ16488.1 hypothetical protein [Glutamicibacter soli]
MVEAILILFSLQLNTVEADGPLANQSAAPVERVVNQAWGDEAAIHASATGRLELTVKSAGNEDWPLGSLRSPWNEDWPLSTFDTLGNEDWPL